MPSALVDSNALLDLMTEDGHWFAWSAATLEEAACRSRLVIDPVIYAEGLHPLFKHRGPRGRLTEHSAGARSNSVRGSLPGREMPRRVP
jgi:hypothetical protein